MILAAIGKLTLVVEQDSERVDVAPHYAAGWELKNRAELGCRHSMAWWSRTKGRAGLDRAGRGSRYMELRVWR